MNEVKDRMTGVVVHPVPLFASSWVALFCLLRTSFVNGRNEAKDAAEPNQSRSGDTRQ
ncbi:MAG: hypothetical protein ACI9H8_001359 [Lysobacterales bacterium]|jgi:hypothetical protein